MNAVAQFPMTRRTDSQSVRESARHSFGRIWNPSYSPIVLVAFAVIGSPAGSADEAPRFGRDVLPILSDNCFGCHGPDAPSRKADLRLDTREGALAVLSLEKPDDSALLERIMTDDETLVMPPKKSNRHLTAEQKAMLRRWVAAGAPWGKHWAFEKPVRPTPPETAQQPNLHPIDAFIRARLAQEGLRPSPAAPRAKLIRRLSFDLVGLPPTLEEVDAFERDTHPDAYSRLVSRLLDSSHFGERMAVWWLDAARYADTDGFQGDATRTNWPWRDWVVAAFNRNQRFDEFTIEQFAGDLLPNATAEQKLATCFHRNHMTNGEGGRDPEESRIDYVMDRVSTTGTVWLGLTLGCCQCHSHKFDPITQHDYYSLFAFFNSIDEDGKAAAGARPYLSYQSPLAARAVAEAKQLVDERVPREATAKADAELPFSQWLTARVAEVQNGYGAWHTLKASSIGSSEGTELAQEADGTIRTVGQNPRQDDYRIAAPAPLPRITGLRLEVFPHEAHTNGGYTRGESGHFILTDIKVLVQRTGSSQTREVAVAGAVADLQADPKKNDGYGEVKHVLDDDPRNGWTTTGESGWHPHRAIFAFVEPLVLDSDEEIVFEMRHRSTRGHANIGLFRLAVTDQPGPAVQSVDPAPLEELAEILRGTGTLTDLGGALRTRLFEQFLADYAPFQTEKQALDRAKAQFAEMQRGAESVNVMVLSERAEPRETHLLVRGVWDQKGEKVERSVPAGVAPWPEGIEKNRLGLARWIVSPENPLTARVVANHLWQLCFGAGLVATPEDFGLQGERPSHPELLDWLAVELVESGWDLKHLLKVIVTSETYRQSSTVDEALRARDPNNRLLARGARYRLPSWMIRDGALQAAGLMNPALGGPPVRPYQPDGVWEELFMGRYHYEPSEGAAQYRRTVYAFWRRAVGPTFLFDAPQRRVCEVRTMRTNTPLQALTLLNDRSILDASQALARQAVAREGSSEARLARLFRQVLSRKPTEAELAVLKREWNKTATYYRAHRDEAMELLKTRSNATPNDKPEIADEAAYMVTASLLLNLDEAISHE